MNLEELRDFKEFQNSRISDNTERNLKKSMNSIELRDFKKFKKSEESNEFMRNQGIL